MTELPSRRMHIERMTKAESAIRHAILEVEEAGTDPRLTNAVVLMLEAREWVGDFVDGIQRQTPGPPPPANRASADAQARAEGYREGWRAGIEAACAAVCWRCEGGELVEPKSLRHYDGSDKCYAIRARAAAPSTGGKP